MNSVAPIASNRVYVKEKYFNGSNFICKERSQWRLESRQSLFFPVFVCFVFCCCRCCFSIDYNYFPLAYFPLFSLLTLYASRDFSDYVFLVINIYSIFRNSLVKFRVFWVAPLNVSLSGFFFLFAYCPDLFGNEGTKLKVTDQGCTSTLQIDDANGTTDLTDRLYWYFVLVPAKCTKFLRSV